jgi:predicted DCC family thiol-disulfide oxidoreductase YuxK
MRSILPDYPFCCPALGERASLCPDAKDNCHSRARTEIDFLQSRNAQGQLAFVDVTQTGFEAAGHNISCEAAMAQIHGRTADGTVLVGVPVFASAYRLAKLPVLAWLLSRKWLMPVLQPAYVLFAKHRQAISKRIGPSVLKFSKRFLR